MKELRFPKTVYRGESVDEAVKTFARHATCELVEEPATWVVRLTANKPERERAVAGELGNWALGSTIRAKGTQR